MAGPGLGDGHIGGGKTLYDLEKSEPSLVVRSRYVRLTGDLIAGILLSQLSYWFAPGKSGKSKLRVHKRGKEWVAKSRGDWAAELLISPKQFDRAVRLLGGMGLVQAEIFRFDSKPMTHLWLDVPALTNAVVYHLTKGQSRSLPSGKLHVDQRSKPLTETTTETTDIEKSPAVAGADSESGKVLQFPIGEHRKASEILAMKAKEQAGKLTGSQPLAIAIQWKAAVSAAYPGTFVKDPTGKERALLKQVLQATGEQARPLITFVTANWIRFAIEVRHAKGLTKSPEQPDVWFFRNHYEIGLQLIAEASKPAKPVLQPMPRAAIPSPTPKPVHKPATPEEVQALINDIFK